MAFVFNADEVFKMAERVERNGAAFYRLAAEHFPKQSRVFLILADQEDKHRETFAAMRRNLPPKAREETAYDPGNEASAYLKAMADRRIFDIQRVPGEILKGAHTLEEVIQVAIGLEKDSIVFYTGMQAMVPAEFGKDNLAPIIREEFKHIVFLNNLAAEQSPIKIADCRFMIAD